MKRLLCLVLPPLLVAIIATVALARGVTAHPDEPLWIASAYYFDRLVHGDVSHPDWQLLPARETPPVGKYLFGAALWLQGRPIRSIEPLASWYEGWRAVPGAFGTGREAAEREAVVHRLPADVRTAVSQGLYVPIGQRELLSARLIAATFGLVFAFAVAVLGQSCRGPVTGLVAGSIVAVHPLAVHAYTHALVDIIALAFSVLAVLGLIALLPSPLASFKIARAGADLRVRPGADTSVSPYHGILKPAVVTGLFLALAVGSKMNALIVVMVAAALFLVLAARASGLQARRLQIPDLAPVLALAVGLLLFIAMNPSLYSDVPGGLRDLIAVPARTTRLQASFLPDYLPTASARLGTVAILLCGYQIGLLFLVALAIRPTWLAMRCLSARSVVVLWWWIALLAVTAWIPFPWPRYALPLLPPAAVLIADAVVESLHAVASPT